MSKKKRSKKRHESSAARVLGRAGLATKQPLLWLVATLLMAAGGGAKGRRAAVRGSACYLLGAAAGNLPKPLFGRAQPRHRKPKSPEILRGSFPSGHAAAEVAYTFGAAQEAPLAFIPFGAMAMLAHWALVRGRKHYVSDTLVGGTLGLVIALITAKAWPPPPAGPLAMLPRLSSNAA